MEEKNLLAEWYQNAKVISSPINISPKIDRKIVDFIYQQLTTYLGLDYFKIAVGKEKPIEKTSWLHSLTANTNRLGCIYALYEVCYLLEYLQQLPDDIKNEFSRLKHNPTNLRSFFFELFTYNILDSNGIQNTKKDQVGKQIIEGTCSVNNVSFLFECRQVYFPRVNELDILRRLMVDFWKQVQKLNKGFGMICTIQVNKPVTGAHRNSFEGKIRAFFEKFRNFKSLHTIDYFVEDEFGIFKVVNYDEATLIEVQQLHNYDVLFYIIPPAIIAPNIPNHYSTRVDCNFSVYHSKVYSKLETVLKEKKRQHKDSQFENKILFIGSEALPEFHFGLFQNPFAFDFTEVKKVCDKSGFDGIVCFINRNYLDDYPKFEINVIYPQKFANEAKAIEDAFISHPFRNAK